MVKFFSDEFFKEVEQRLVADAKWQQDTKGMKTTILFAATDLATWHLLKVEDGLTAVSRVDGATATAPEFSFEGTYDSWMRVAKGEIDFQSAVLKGQLRFRGSITKILAYRDKFMRIAEVIRSIPVEF